MLETLRNILGINANYGRWSEMVTVKLPDIMSGSITFESIVSIRKFACKKTKVQISKFKKQWLGQNISQQSERFW